METSVNFYNTFGANFRNAKNKMADENDNFVAKNQNSLFDNNVIFSNDDDTEVYEDDILFDNDDSTKTSMSIFLGEGTKSNFITSTPNRNHGNSDLIQSPSSDIASPMETMTANDDLVSLFGKNKNISGIKIYFI